MAEIFWYLKRFSFKAVDLTIVSNQLLVPEALRLCQSAVALIDPLPEMGCRADHPQEYIPNCTYVMFVCSHERDEPISLLMSVVRRILIETDLGIVITGVVPPGSPFLGLAPSSRVTMPGFLPWYEYCQLMWYADTVVVLTEDRDSLCCGAYEAVQCSKPLVLSDHPILREVFDGCAEFTQLDSEAVYNAIIRGSTSTSNGKNSLEIARDKLQRRFETELASFVVHRGCVKLR